MVMKNHWRIIIKCRNGLSKLIESLSYKSVINRGYAVIRNSSKKPVQKSRDILSDRKINIELKDGIIEGKIDWWVQL